MLNHLVFRAEARKAVQVHPSKPLLIPAGADSIEKIGVPPGCTMSDITVGSLESRIDKWRGAVEVYFKPSSEGKARPSLCVNRAPQALFLSRQC